MSALKRRERLQCGIATESFRNHAGLVPTSPATDRRLGPERPPKFLANSDFIKNENRMRLGIIGLVLLVLIIAALLQNVFIGGLGGLILIVLVVLLLIGKI